MRRGSPLLGHLFVAGLMSNREERKSLARCQICQKLPENAKNLGIFRAKQLLHNHTETNWHALLLGNDYKSFTRAVKTAKVACYCLEQKEQLLWAYKSQWESMISKMCQQDCSLRQLVKPQQRFGRDGDIRVIKGRRYFLQKRENKE